MPHSSTKVLTTKLYKSEITFDSITRSLTILRLECAGTLTYGSAFIIQFEICGWVKYEGRHAREAPGESL